MGVLQIVLIGRRVVEGHLVVFEGVATTATSEENSRPHTGTHQYQHSNHHADDDDDGAVVVVGRWGRGGTVIVARGHGTRYLVLPDHPLDCRSVVSGIESGGACLRGHIWGGGVGAAEGHSGGGGLPDGALDVREEGCWFRCCLHHDVEDRFGGRGGGGCSGDGCSCGGGGR